MNIRITVFNKSVSLGLMNPFKNSKPLYIRYLPDNRYSYNFILNLVIVYIYYSNLDNV